MSYLRGPDRSEVQLLPPCLDDDVAADAPARFIDAYAEGLDFASLGFTHARPRDTGRPPYHPADLLKLYLYGYLHRIRSSRRQEAEAARNLEVVWLLHRVRPDFKTIANFRRENRAAFRPLLRDINLLCRKMVLFGAELVALDGSKFKASNNSRRHYTREQLCELPGKIEARIEEYLGELDRLDAQAEGVPAVPGREALAEKIARLRECGGRYEWQLGELAQSGENEIAPSDADSRKMRGAHGGHFIGYDALADAERAAARVAAHPGIVARRKTIVEHAFGTLRVWSHDHFLMRGLGKVRAKFSLSASAYNLRRVLSLRSVGQLPAARPSHARRTPRPELAGAHCAIPLNLRTAPEDTARRSTRLVLEKNDSEPSRPAHSTSRSRPPHPVGSS